MKPETRVNHPQHVELPADNHPLVMPIYQNVKFEYDTLAETLRAELGERPGYTYSRVANPTVRQLELLLAGLQGRDDCMTCASGVNAVAQALVSLTRAGDHVLMFAQSYGPSRRIVKRILGRFGVTHTILSIDDLAGIERTLALTPTRLVLFESPTNPMTRIADIPRITALARAANALTVADNTLAGFHQHGEFDIDVFIHSLTKYTAGTGDVMGGAVIANEALIKAMRPDWILFGAQLDPHAAFLMMRGMRTYFLRYRAQAAAALRIAQFLVARPEVLRVHYPGLASHPQAELARAQMQEQGTVVTIDVAGGEPSANRFVDALQLFAATSSLGSTESLVMSPGMLAPRDLTGEALEWSGIGPGTVRLSIGLEDVGDLEEDLTAALATAEP
jgi:cystathionine beta-lyase/cystathionine gamma-synthase